MLPRTGSGQPHVGHPAKKREGCPPQCALNFKFHAIKLGRVGESLMFYMGNPSNYHVHCAKHTKSGKFGKIK